MKWQLGSTQREASAYLPSCLWSSFGTVAWMHKAVSDWLTLILIQFLCRCYALDGMEPFDLICVLHKVIWGNLLYCCVFPIVGKQQMSNLV